jgi:hypothetical protein
LAVGEGQLIRSSWQWITAVQTINYEKDRSANLGDFLHSLSPYHHNRIEAIITIVQCTYSLQNVYCRMLVWPAGLNGGYYSLEMELVPNYILYRQWDQTIWTTGCSRNQIYHMSVRFFLFFWPFLCTFDPKSLTHLLVFWEFSGKFFARCASQKIMWVLEN